MGRAVRKLEFYMWQVWLAFFQENDWQSGCMDIIVD